MSSCQEREGAQKTFYYYRPYLINKKDNKGGGVKNCQFWDDIVYGWPLSGGIPVIMKETPYPNCLSTQASTLPMLFFLKEWQSHEVKMNWVLHTVMMREYDF